MPGQTKAPQLSSGRERAPFFVALMVTRAFNLFNSSEVYGSLSPKHRPSVCMRLFPERGRCGGSMSAQSSASGAQAWCFKGSMVFYTIFLLLAKINCWSQGNQVAENPVLLPR